MNELTFELDKKTLENDARTAPLTINIDDRKQNEKNSALQIFSIDP